MSFLNHPGNGQSVSTEQAATDLKGRIDKYLHPTEELTFGQRAVGITFNHGKGDISEQIHEAKVTCASAIDQMNDLRAVSTSGEYKALATISTRAVQAAQMAMVKAITWQD